MDSTPRRSRRRVFVDPRFAVGVLLILLSVLGVVALVDSANASVEVLAARATLSPGERIRLDDLAPTSVRVGRTAGLYLTATDVPAAGVIVTRAIAAGELVPRSAVGRPSGNRMTYIVVALSGDLPQSVVTGSRVDLWSTADGASASSADASTSDTSDPSQASHQPPTVLVSAATVVRVVAAKQFAQSPGSSIELLVPKADAATVLDAIANGATLTALPVDLPLGG